MTIPEVRGRLLELAAELRGNEDESDVSVAHELEVLAEELRRRQSRPKAPRASVSMTPELAEVVRVYALEHPDLTEFQVGAIFGVNQGRVSEALRGFRT